MTGLVVLKERERSLPASARTVTGGHSDKVAVCEPAGPSSDLPLRAPGLGFQPPELGENELLS